MMKDFWLWPAQIAAAAERLADGTVQWERTAADESKAVRRVRKERLHGSRCCRERLPSLLLG
jgi:hypothetical protein